MDTLTSKEQRIIAAAELIFSKHGFEKATVDEIIALADVGKGTLYKYFGNKEQLFYKLVCEKNADFVAKLQQAAASTTELEPRMVAYFTEMIIFYRANAALWQIIFFEMLGSSNGCIVKKIDGVPQVVSRYQTEPSAAVKDTVMRYYRILEAEFGVLQQMFQEATQDGLLKNGDPEISAHFFFFGIAMTIFHAHDSLEKNTPKGMAKIAVDRILHGLS